MNELVYVKCVLSSAVKYVNYVAAVQTIKKLYSTNLHIQMNLVPSINGEKMRILLWFIHVTAVVSILLGIVCLFNEKISLGVFVIVNGLSQFFTSILFHGQQKHIDLQIVNKHLAESVFGPSADRIKRNMQNECVKIKTEIIEQVKEEVRKVGNGQ